MEGRKKMSEMVATVLNEEAKDLIS